MLSLKLLIVPVCMLKRVNLELSIHIKGQIRMYLSVMAHSFSVVVDDIFWSFEINELMLDKYTEGIGSATIK